VNHHQVAVVQLYRTDLQRSTCLIVAQMDDDVRLTWARLT